MCLFYFSFMNTTAYEGMLDVLATSAMFPVMNTLLHAY